MSGWPGWSLIGLLRRGDGRVYGVCTERRVRKVPQLDQTLPSHDGGSLQDITQLPHITGPIIPIKKIQHFGIDSCNLRTVLLVQTLQHDIGDRRDIFFMVTQRRNYDLEYAQPVEKFFAQMRSESLAGRGKYSGVYWDFLLSAKPPHPQVLKNAQQLWLRWLRHLADLVEKQSAPMSLLKATGRALHGSRKRSFLVAE